ncbi:MAG: hypothetical protein IPH53_20115 [Flavobacteriales bacterium]|nr:hypothetical protein [Flavobacteriales bacterium]
MLRVLGAGLMLFTLALVANLFTYSVTVDNTDLDHQRNFNDGYKIFSLRCQTASSCAASLFPWGSWTFASVSTANFW